jgi:hypothetical protein
MQSFLSFGPLNPVILPAIIVKSIQKSRYWNEGLSLHFACLPKQSNLT